MTREVYNDKRFIEFSRKHVFIRLFQDTEQQGARLAARYGVDGFPTLIIFNSSGKEIDRILGFRSTPDLIEEIQSIIEESKGRISL